MLSGELETKIKKKLTRHLQSLGFRKQGVGMLAPPSDKKRSVRNLHDRQRRDLIASEKAFINKRIHLLDKYFASGIEVIPQKIAPRLELINSKHWQSDVFRLASLTWSVPVSRGYGRRLRFLIWDDYNNKLIGLIALGDPVFNSRVRDNYLGWTPTDRNKRLVNCMDAYVLGAVPPYNFLLGGKLIACLVRTKEIREAFREKYGDTKGIISGKKKNANLAVVTTSSALGKSAVYNRLKLGETQYFRSIGYTEGWGHFHIPNSLFADLRKYLEVLGHPYAKGHQYGQGPNWKMRVTRAAFKKMGLDGDILRHGINREVYACEFLENCSNYLTGKSKEPRLDNVLTIKEVGILALNRWIIPRAMRRPEFMYWKKDDLKQLIFPDGSNRVTLKKPQKRGITRDIKRFQKTLDPHDQDIFLGNVKHLQNQQLRL